MSISEIYHNKLLSGPIYYLYGLRRIDHIRVVQVSVQFFSHSSFALQTATRKKLPLDLYLADMIDPSQPVQIIVLLQMALTKR